MKTEWLPITFNNLPYFKSQLNLTEDDSSNIFFNSHQLKTAVHLAGYSSIFMKGVNRRFDHVIPKKDRWSSRKVEFPSDENEMNVKWPQLTMEINKGAMNQVRNEDEGATYIKQLNDGIREVLMGSQKHFANENIAGSSLDLSSFIALSYFGMPFIEKIGENGGEKAIGVALLLFIQGSMSYISRSLLFGSGREAAGAKFSAFSGYKLDRMLALYVHLNTTTFITDQRGRQ